MLLGCMIGMQFQPETLTLPPKKSILCLWKFLKCPVHLFIVTVHCLPRRSTGKWPWNLSSKRLSCGLSKFVCACICRLVLLWHQDFAARLVVVVFLCDATAPLQWQWQISLCVNAATPSPFLAMHALCVRGPTTTRSSQMLLVSKLWCGWQFCCFLPFVFQMVQLAYFGYSVINDVFGSNMLPSEYDRATNIPALQRFRDFFAASIAFPGSLVLAVLFMNILFVYCYQLCIVQVILRAWKNCLWMDRQSDICGCREQWN